MANNYIQFSQAIERLTDEEYEWLVRVLQDPMLMSAAEFTRWQGDFPSLADDWEFWPAFGFEFGSSWLVVHSMGDGDLVNVTRLIHLFLGKFRPADSWGLEWAETCSKPRVGEFGGGWVLITARSTTWGSTREALNAAKEAP